MAKISKQVIVMRKDLNMRKGKMVAQGAHASLKVILDQMDSYTDKDKDRKLTLFIDNESALDAWIEGKFTKICLSVNSEKELLEIFNKAKEKGLLCTLIRDAGLTEFNGVPTLTCCAIGPNWADEIDEITGKLPLL